MAEIFKALSNPNRLKIFLRLTTCCRPGTVGIYDENDDVDAMFIGDLGKDLAVGKPTVSHQRVTEVAKPDQDCVPRPIGAKSSPKSLNESCHVVAHTAFPELAKKC